MGRSISSAWPFAADGWRSAGEGTLHDDRDRDFRFALGLLYGEQAPSAHAFRMGRTSRYAGEYAAEAERGMGASPATDSGSLALHDAHREATTVQGAPPMGLRPEPA